MKIKTFAFFKTIFVFLWFFDILLAAVYTHNANFSYIFALLNIAVLICVEGLSANAILTQSKKGEDDKYETLKSYFSFFSLHEPAKLCSSIPEVTILISAYKKLSPYKAVTIVMLFVGIAIFNL